MGCWIVKLPLLLAAMAMLVMSNSAAATATGKPTAYYPFHGSSWKIGRKVISTRHHIGIHPRKYLQRDLASLMGQESPWTSSKKADQSPPPPIPNHQIHVLGVPPPPPPM